MKQKDIALVIVVAVVSLVIASVLSNVLFGGTGSNRTLTAEKVTKISETFEQPNNKYFNDQAVDPTETISITTNDNQTPFKQGE